MFPVSDDKPRTARPALSRPGDNPSSKNISSLTGFIVYSLRLLLK